MAKDVTLKSEYIITLAAAILFILASRISLTSISSLQENSKIINTVGIVRGETQRLITEEMQGYHDAKLIAYLDTVIYDLSSEKGNWDIRLIKDDNIFRSLMSQVTIYWEKIKEEIGHVRAGKDSEELFELSEEFFELVGMTFLAVERFSDGKAQNSRRILKIAYVAFACFAVFGFLYYLKTADLKRKAALLNKLAYLDTLTQMPNRAACEEIIDKYISNNSEKLLSVVIFDVNDLKEVNHKKGHQGGDRQIAEFGRILKDEAKEFGFIGRYGGDEFLGIFEDCSEADIKSFIDAVNKKVTNLNRFRRDEAEKIYFASGYCIGNENNNDPAKLINSADHIMYENKRLMRESRTRNTSPPLGV